MKLRSLLFVPGDRPERFAKAIACGADAIILDLEDSVAPAMKAAARDHIRTQLGAPRACPLFVRINALGSGFEVDDLAVILPGRPDAVVLPKAEGAQSVGQLLALMGDHRAPIFPIATETPAAIFELGTYAQCRDQLVGLTWGAEDLPAAMGASSARESDGRFTPPIELARSLTLFGAQKAGVPAIETVYPDFRDLEGLAAYAARGRRDGYVGMMAIHPAQVAVINDAFTPSAAEIEHARRIVDAFDQAPDAGVLQLDGKMIDQPHLKQARAILSRAPSSN